VLSNTEQCSQQNVLKSLPVHSEGVALTADCVCLQVAVATVPADRQGAAPTSDYTTRLQI